MRIAPVVGLTGVAGALLCAMQGSRTQTLVITGGFDGYLEPCGCTSPMTGGILRQATLVRQLRRTQEVTYIANGDLVNVGAGQALLKQDLMKTETLADVLHELGIDAINLSLEDARLGVSGTQAIQNITEGRLISGSIDAHGSPPVKASIQSGRFLIGGITSNPQRIGSYLSESPIDANEAVSRFLADARDQDLAPILMLDGDEQATEGLAKAHPSIKLIVYSSKNDPPSAATMVGDVLLATPGARGKFIVKLDYDGARFTNYRAIELGPNVADDAKVSMIYNAYLKRVDSAGLLEGLSRSPSGAFAGSLACKSCHGRTYEVWHESRHARAYSDLVAKQHARDPDCVGCHVVGLTSLGGFTSDRSTANLAGVGCESCHGPGQKHGANPKRFQLPRVGLKVCSSCHTSDQSPGFNAIMSWVKIQHK